MCNKNRIQRILIIVTILAVGNFGSFAQGIQFMHDLDSALNLAKNQNKPIFIDFFTSWCGPCKVMSNNVFPQEKVGNFFNKQFINCKIQCDDKGIGEKLCKIYQVNSYPTLMFLDSNGKLIHSAAGSLSADELIDLSKIALNPEKNLMSLLNKWNTGKRDTAFVNNYFNNLKIAYRTELAKSQFGDYFNSLTYQEKTSKNTFELICLLGTPPFTPLFSFVEKNKEIFKKTVGSEKIDKYLSDSYLWHLRNLALEKGTAAHLRYLDKKNQFKDKKYSTYDEVAMFLSVHETFDTTGMINIKEYQSRGTSFLDKYGLNNENYTISLVHLLGNCTGRENEGNAGIQWMENLLSRNNDPKYLRTYFYILWRNHNFDKALAIGQEIRKNDIRNNQSTNEIDRQIEMVTKLKEKKAEKNANSSKM